MTKIKDKPWMIRTYAGHSQLQIQINFIEKILPKGRRVIVARFITQTGYDSDHILSKGEVGKLKSQVILKYKLYLTKFH